MAPLAHPHEPALTMERMFTFCLSTKSLGYQTPSTLHDDAGKRSAVLVASPLVDRCSDDRPTLLNSIPRAILASSDVIV